MTRRALLVLSDGFEDIEAVAPVDVLNRSGVEVTLASLEEGPVRGAYGCTIVPTARLSSVSGLFDALIIPGGKVNAENLASSPKVRAVIREHFSAQRIVAAICAAPALVLGQSARIMEGKNATCDPYFKDILSACGASYTNQALTVDGTIITAMGPGAALAFGLKLSELLVGLSVADALAARWGISL